MYSTDNSGRFVNGVLDNIAKAKLGAVSKSNAPQTAKGSAGCRNKANSQG